MSDTPDADAAREIELRALLGLPTQSADELDKIIRRSAASRLPMHQELLALARRSESRAATLGINSA